MINTMNELNGPLGDRIKYSPIGTQVMAQRSQSEIDRELGQLQTAVNVLGETIMQLADRLSSVRAPSPERAGQAEASEPQAPSKVGSSIQSSRRDVQLHNMKLLELMASLAV